MQDPNKSTARKICAIVGAGPDLGLSLAKRFGQKGFEIVFVTRRPDKRKAYVAILRDAGLIAHSVPADPVNAESIVQAFDLIKKLGSPEVMIYNATRRGPRDAPSKLDTRSLIEDYMINVTAPLLCAQQVIPDMRARGNGTIFFTAGGYGSRNELPFTTLAMGKACVRILCNSLNKDLSRYGIHVATVYVRGDMQPGTVANDGLQPQKLVKADRVVITAVNEPALRQFG